MKLFSPGTEGLNDCASTLSPLCWRGAESTCSLLRQIPLGVLRVALAFCPQLAPLCAALVCAFASYPKTLRTLRPPPGPLCAAERTTKSKCYAQPFRSHRRSALGIRVFLRLQSPRRGSLVAAGTRLPARSGHRGRGAADHHPAGSLRHPPDGWTPAATLPLARPLQPPTPRPLGATPSPTY